MKLGSGMLARGVQGPGFSLQYLQKGERKRNPIGVVPLLFVDACQGETSSG